jgi:DNA-binding NarL/FixJ family response regulator
MEQIEKLQPDLVVLDLSLGGEDGLELIRRMVHSREDLKVIVYSVQNEMTYGERVLRSGAHGYLMKHRHLDELLEAARRVMKGEIAISSRLNASILQRRRGPSCPDASSDPQIQSLTDRELQVLRYIGAGYTTGQIARLLHVSPKTVGAHKENLKSKLAAGTGGELVQQAVSLVREGVV